MSSKLPKITSSDLIRVLKKLGYILKRQKGSHAVFRNNGNRVVVPIHIGQIIKPKTLQSIINDMDIEIEDFKNML